MVISFFRLNIHLEMMRKKDCHRNWILVILLIVMWQYLEKLTDLRYMKSIYWHETPNIKILSEFTIQIRIIALLIHQYMERIRSSLESCDSSYHQTSPTSPQFQSLRFPCLLTKMSPAGHSPDHARIIKLTTLRNLLNLYDQQSSGLQEISSNRV